MFERPFTKGSIFCRAILVIFTFDNLFKMIMPLGKGLNYFVKLFLFTKNKQTKKITYFLLKLG